MATAEAMPERFWVPLNIDFRGRIYPIPHFNFTRDDRVRGLFLFADGKPIGKEGLFWLKAHVAARADGVTWSDHTGPRLSELGFAERVAWTNANSELLLRIGKAVLDGDDPATLDWALPKEELHPVYRRLRRTGAGLGQSGVRDQTAFNLRRFLQRSPASLRDDAGRRRRPLCEFDPERRN